MDNPAARSLIETVRKFNEMAQRARSGQPEPEDYLKVLSSDPATEWFTDLLREKNEELDQERQRSDRLVSALRAWYKAKDVKMPDGSTNREERRLVNLLREMGIIEAVD